MDYESLGLKVGLEIHQQLDTHKLFCNCPSELSDAKAKEFMRMLRPTQSEMGEVDRAALSEAKKNLKFRYQAPPTVCLVEADEEPPHDANEEAIEIVLEFTALVNAEPVDEIHFMRKVVIDGSNTAGFQRTALIALNGKLRMGYGHEKGPIGITTICLEEDAARKVEKKGSEVTYRLDRLGIPLIEVATGPDIRTPSQAREVAERIGNLLRATKKVKRGLGTVREDLNISISEGARVEIKGVQELRMISRYVEEEVTRQLGLIIAKKELEKRGVKKGDFGEIKELTGIFADTESRVIKNKLKKGGVVLGMKLGGFAGLLGGQFLSEKDGKKVEQGIRKGRILGPELADYVNSIGVLGLFHSDELPDYGITEKEIEEVSKELNMESQDAFVLIAEEKEKAKEAMEMMKSRAGMAFDGVLEETRDPLPDGTSKYSRPLPGKARMYPETDVRPIRVTLERLKRIEARLPELPEDLLRRFIEQYSLSQEQASQLISSGYDEIFEALTAKHKSKKMANIIAKTLLNTIPELASEGVNTEKLDQVILDEIFDLVKSGKFAKEGISKVLRHVVEEGVPVKQALSDLNLEGVGDEEMEKVIDSIVSERIDFIKEKKMDALGPLMGLVMKELRGKVDGKKVSEALKNKIHEILN
jgi:glutamyl-tRNA(Gln) amidotransferase subunit E